MSHVYIYLASLDWLLERFRTAVNVLGDAIGAEIVAQISKEDLLKISRAGEPQDLPSYSNATEQSEVATSSVDDLEKGPD